ncbi:MAG: hypothetical protein A2068_12610 [Ignavibacteria bacterium GWB2_35_6b]|nr:MAG: hypothetical protein A2068_12610 [Ignavibacteria bacterium GWB2_35_6b]
MKFFTNIFFITIIFSFINFSGLQAQKQLTSEQLQPQHDSLTAYKDHLKRFIESLKKELDTLTKHRDYLDEKIKLAYEKTYIKKYGKEHGPMVAEGRIWKGMTESMLRDSWGKPDKTNTDKFKYGVFTQYEYGDITFFFRDKVLIDWEDKGKK